MKTIKPAIKTLDIRKASSPSTERIRGRKRKRIRDRIALRDGYTCARCGRVTARFEIDHKTPLHMGGAESDENRQLLCKRCHGIKTEEEGERRGTA